MEIILINDGSSSKEKMIVDDLKICPHIIDISMGEYAVSCNPIHSNSFATCLGVVVNAIMPLQGAMAHLDPLACLGIKQELGLSLDEAIHRFFIRSIIDMINDLPNAILEIYLFAGSIFRGRINPMRLVGELWEMRTGFEGKTIHSIYDYRTITNVDPHYGRALFLPYDNMLYLFRNTCTDFISDVEKLIDRKIPIKSGVSNIEASKLGKAVKKEFAYECTLKRV